MQRKKNDNSFLPELLKASRGRIKSVAAGQHISHVIRAEEKQRLYKKKTTTTTRARLLSSSSESVSTNSATNKEEDSTNHSLHQEFNNTFRSPVINTDLQALEKYSEWEPIYYHCKVALQSVSDPSIFLKNDSSSPYSTFIIKKDPLNTSLRGPVKSCDHIWLELAGIDKPPSNTPLFNPEYYVGSCPYDKKKQNGCEFVENLNEFDNWQVRQWASSKRKSSTSFSVPTILEASVPSSSRYDIINDKEAIEYFKETNDRVMKLGKWEMKLVNKRSSSNIIIRNFSKVQLLQSSMVLTAAVEESGKNQERIRNYKEDILSY